MNIEIIELGAGHGHFSHLFLQGLIEIQDQLPFPLPQPLLSLRNNGHVMVTSSTTVPEILVCAKMKVLINTAIRDKILFML